jgi:hypothetical protein
MQNALRHKTTSADITTAQEWSNLHSKLCHKIVGGADNWMRAESRVICVANHTDKSKRK